MDQDRVRPLVPRAGCSKIHPQTRVEPPRRSPERPKTDWTPRESSRNLSSKSRRLSPSRRKSPLHEYDRFYSSARRHETSPRRFHKSPPRGNNSWNSGRQGGRREPPRRVSDWDGYESRRDRGYMSSERTTPLTEEVAYFYHVGSRHLLSTYR